MDQEDLKYMQEKWPSMIEQMREVGKVYEATYKALGKEKKADSVVAANIAIQEVGRRNLIKKLDTKKEELGNLETKLNTKTLYKNISTEGKQIVFLDAEIRSIKEARSKVNKKLSNKNLSKEDWESYTLLRDNLIKKIESLEGTIKEIYKTESYNPEARKKDRELIKKLPIDLINNLNSLNNSIADIETAIESKSERIDKLKGVKPVKPDIIAKKTPEQVRKEEEEARLKAEEEKAKMEVTLKKAEEALTKHGNTKVKDLIPT
ncbi:hypothetical protein HC823_02015, partial [Candidatus Gracilibacteria bacterium]|nr:hypothetical protein [Candidatus Gracilibacteria bacterium]